MFGLRFVKVQPTTFVIQYAGGRVRRKGPGLAFFYYAPATSLVAIPIGSIDVPFIFHEATADFQEVTVQGQVTYRIAAPEQVATLLNFALDGTGARYTSDDPEKLPQRIVNHIQVLTRAQLQSMALRDALRASDALGQAVMGDLRSAEGVTSLGIEILGLSFLAIKATPEMARALEAEARELLLRAADQAIYARRNAAVEQERAIKENELNTEIAVEHKKRQIAEAKMDAERVVQEKRRQIQEAEMATRIGLEQQRKELVKVAADNAREEADARSYATAAGLKPLKELDPKTLQALASTGMEPGQLIALAFREISENAGKIGQLNLSPDLLQALLEAGGREPAGSGAARRRNRE